MKLLSDYISLNINWQEQASNHIKSYTDKQHSFIPYLLPEQAVSLSTKEVLSILEQRFGREKLQEALHPEHTTQSPLAQEKTTNWLKTTKMVGVNVRTIHSFWNVVKYALTLPYFQSAIHLLPIWEPGVVSSLYGIASWNINPAFFSEELYQEHKHLDRIEKQLKVTINVLHLMGKSVGMDVIPHTDRFSEIVLANPHYFEWLQRIDTEITNHRADLHTVIQTEIMEFLAKNGSAKTIAYPKEKSAFFSTQFGEHRRVEVLFGDKFAYGKRNKRRIQLMDHLFEKGYEPVPATMAPPYRGLKVDTDETAKTVDADGRVWRDYKITEPEEFSRVFGPLTRFKLYERKNDNQDWEIDFEQPRTEVWDYIKERYFEVQYLYNIDFMRGDMSHVQMRPTVLESDVNDYYDPLKAIKNHIGDYKPYFAYFAESFLAPPDVMGYGDEVQHLERADAETTLGDLQSMVVGSDVFMQHFERYLNIAEDSPMKPNFTIMTADKDDPRFDEFYVAGNIARFFISLFLQNLPSYMGLGFECRDTHLSPAPNEHYTKLYVFQIDKGSKATTGDYVWGKNGALFYEINELRKLGEQVIPQIADRKTHWLKRPADSSVIVWTQKEAAQYLFVVNLNLQQKVSSKIDYKTEKQTSIFYSNTQHQPIITSNHNHLFVENMEAGACLIIELQ